MFDPTTLIDDRDDAAAYRLETYEATPYDAAAERGRQRAADIEHALATNDWSVVESWDGIHDDNVHALLDPTTRGESVTYTTPAPSWSVSTVSERKVSRGKKGTSTRITYRGRAAVVGDSQAMDDATTRSGRVPRVVVAHAIDQLRGGQRYGHADGDKLAALTSRLFDIPALIGSEHWSWSEATPEVPVSPAVIANAVHTCGISGGMSPRLDAAVGPEYRTRDDDPRWFPTSYPRKHYPRSMSTRLRLATPRRRKLDPAPMDAVQLADRSMPWRAWFLVTEERAPHVDPRRMFLGHRAVTRGLTMKESAKRATAAKVRESFVIDNDPRESLPALLATIADDGPGKYAWSTLDRSMSGQLTIDKRSRFSITGLGDPIRQKVTLDAVRRALATR